MVHSLQNPEFSLGLVKYPIGDEFELAGGYWSRSEPSKLEEVHLSIRVYPVGGRGQLCVRVRTFEPFATDSLTDSDHLAEVELLTTYNLLADFGQQLPSVVDGVAPEALLRVERLA